MFRTLFMFSIVFMFVLSCNKNENQLPDPSGIEVLDEDNNEVTEDTDSDTISENMPNGSLGFTQTGPVGGGFPNVATWDPNVPGKVYFGSDIGGTGTSINYGKDFETTSRGLGYEESHSKIAALNAIDMSGSTIIVGGTGFRGIGGEVISSTDGGSNWNHDSSDIAFSAQNSSAPLPTGRPRSTDPSLIQWVSGTIWVAGTYKEGLWISTNNRANWSRLNVFDGNAYIRAMAMSPNDPNTVYVGLWGDDDSINSKGLWAISKLDGTPSKTKIQGIPDVVESIAVLGNRLYLACGRFGVRSYVPSTGNISDITGPIGTTVMATAIHGSKGTSNTDRIVVGTAEGNGDIWLSDDSGTSWTNTTTAGIGISPWGTNQDLIVFQKHGNWALGGSKCDVATVQVSPHNPDAWVVCATSAIWTTDDAGMTWKPANGFQILTFRDVEISLTGTIALGNVDHDVLVSNDDGEEWTSIGFNKVTVSHAVTFSPDGTELAFSNNERDNNTTAATAGVASSPHKPNSPNLIEINSPETPKRIVGIEWVVLPDGTERLVAAVDDGGVQTIDRSNGSWSNWTSRSTTFMGAQSNSGLRCSIVSNGGSTIFIYDRKTGVWKSTDYGVGWTNILPIPAGEDLGYLAYDDVNDRLYVSTPTEVLRVDEASSSESTTSLFCPTDQPGPMAIDPVGRLLVYAKPLNAANSDIALYRNDAPETNKNSWVDIADITLRNVAADVTDLDVSREYIVLVTAGKGILISENDAP